MAVTGFEEQMYQDIARQREAMEKLADLKEYEVLMKLIGAEYHERRAALHAKLWPDV